jgi:hypothetical protein
MQKKSPMATFKTLHFIAIAFINYFFEFRAVKTSKSKSLETYI